MAGVNKVIIIGNLGRDPEIKYTQSNVPVANFSVATSESWKDKTTGEWQEKTEWHRIVAWRYLAERAEKYLRKGKQVYIEGKIETRKWQDKEGQDRYTTEIVARDMQMLGRKDEMEASSGGFGGGETPSSSGTFNPPAMDGGGTQEDDDLPF